MNNFQETLSWEFANITEKFQVSSFPITVLTTYWPNWMWARHMNEFRVCSEFVVTGVLHFRLYK